MFFLYAHNNIKGLFTKCDCITATILSSQFKLIE